MNRPTLHHSKARIAQLEDLIFEWCCDPSGYEISGVKADGTVFVRFRSTTRASAMTAARAFAEALDVHCVLYDRTEDTKFRLALNQFSENAS